MLVLRHELRDFSFDLRKKQLKSDFLVNTYLLVTLSSYRLRESEKKVKFAFKYGFATLKFELRFSIQVDNMFLVNISFLLLRKCFSLVLYYKFGFV